MIRVRTGSRLHFGLLRLPDNEAETCWPNHLGEATIPTRSFGGVGLMVESPGVVVSATPATDWQASGPASQRVLEFARRASRAIPSHLLRPLRFVVEHFPRSHVGLGSGTQTALAVAQAVRLACGLPPGTGVSSARVVSRGERSALGIHGYDRGGFLVEGGRRSDKGISPLCARLPFPESWSLLLVCPPTAPGLHGANESRAFAELLDRPIDHSACEAMCRLVLLGLLPALQEEDLVAFGEALFDFNARSGQWFASVQGGIYADEATADTIRFLRSEGVRGVGQSSWGPTVFAIVEKDQAEVVAARVRERYALDETDVWITGARNEPASIGIE